MSVQDFIGIHRLVIKYFGLDERSELTDSTPSIKPAYAASMAEMNFSEFYECIYFLVHHIPAWCLKNEAIRDVTIYLINQLNLQVTE